VEFVTAVLVAPVLELVAVTVAPLIMAPDASLTVPAKAPVPAFCACTVDKQLSAKTNTISDEKQRLTSPSKVLRVATRNISRTNFIL
jgi:hypothetical protein